MSGNYIFTAATSRFVTTGNAFSDLGTGSVRVDAGASLVTTGYGGAGVWLDDGPWTVTVNGTVGGNGFRGAGISLWGNDPAVTHTVTVGTAGRITGGDYGIYTYHPANITNNGEIGGALIAGIASFHNGNMTIRNNAGGVIGSAHGDGIRLAGDGTHTITNAGTISVGSDDGFAIRVFGANGIDRVTNSGTIDGNVNLGGGHDSLTNSGSGIVTGTIGLGFGDDRLTASASAVVERVFDQEGADTYSLGGGNDFYYAFGQDAHIGTDTVTGGSGNDTYSVADENTAINVNLDSVAHGGVDYGGLYSTTFAARTATGTGVGTDNLSSIENVQGGNFGDKIFGSSAANILDGNDGNDHLWGLGGTDTIRGGRGADLIVGGTGRDYLTGGGDGDVFMFTRTSESGTSATTRDVIRDFQGAGVAGGDHIFLTLIDANTRTTAPGDDAFHFIGNDVAFTGAAGELRAYYDAASDTTIVAGDVNGGGVADFSIALEGGRHVLDAGDFNL